MPQIKSAAKRMKQSAQKEKVNTALKNHMRNIRRNLYAAMKAGDKTKGQDLFREYSSMLDKAVKKGVLKKNTASRRRSRAAVRLAAA